MTTATAGVQTYVTSEDGRAWSEVLLSRAETEVAMELLPRAAENEPDSSPLHVLRAKLAAAWQEQEELLGQEAAEHRPSTGAPISPAMRADNDPEFDLLLNVRLNDPIWLAARLHAVLLRQAEAQ